MAGYERPEFDRRWSHMPLTRITPEQELLLLCIRPDLREAERERAEALLAGKLDWPLLLAQARQQKVLPLLCMQLTRNFINAIPEEAADALKRPLLHGSARNLYLSHQLLGLLELFAGRNIRAVPFKGPVLSEYLFGDINCRTSVDLDILVAGNDLEQAILLLRENGYAFDIDLDLPQFLRLARQGFHAMLIKQGAASCPVELHWELTGRYFSRDMLMEEVQTRLRTVRFQGRDILALSPEDLLLYLCIHASRHYWLQLDFVVCVAALLRKEPRLDWDLIFRLAGSYGAVRMVLLGCHLAREFLGAELRGTVTEMMGRCPQVLAAGRWIMDDLFTDPQDKMRKLTYRAEVRYHWLIMDTLPGRLRYCLRLPLSPTHSDWQWLRLPAPLAGLYYLLRPFRLGLKYLRRIMTK